MQCLNQNLSSETKQITERTTYFLRCLWILIVRELQKLLLVLIYLDIQTLISQHKQAWVCPIESSDDVLEQVQLSSTEKSMILLPQYLHYSNSPEKVYYFYWLFSTARIWKSNFSVTRVLSLSWMVSGLNPPLKMTQGVFDSKFQRIHPYTGILIVQKESKCGNIFVLSP